MNPMSHQCQQLVKRYKLTFQQARQVRAVGPGPAGMPGPWRQTEQAAVYSWVLEHGPTYDKPEPAEGPAA